MLFRDSIPWVINPKSLFSKLVYLGPAQIHWIGFSWVEHCLECFIKDPLTVLKNIASSESVFWQSSSRAEQYFKNAAVCPQLWDVDWQAGSQLPKCLKPYSKNQWSESKIICKVLRYVHVRRDWDCNLWVIHLDVKVEEVGRRGSRKKQIPERVPDYWRFRWRIRRVYRKIIGCSCGVSFGWCRTRANLHRLFCLCSSDIISSQTCRNPWGRPCFSISQVA